MGMLLSLMKRLFLSRSGSMALGLLVAAALVWYAGPYVGVTSVVVRLSIILSIFLLAALYMLGLWWIARKRGKGFQKALDAQQDNDVSRQAEIDSLKQKMDEAVSSLKTSGFGMKYRGSAALYALPWYMVIGPSAAGKSTLLRNSGLHFPYSHADDIDIRGFGGTRNCDWWFSDEAVFLDTAGRYTTEENDHDEWVTFLSLLKRYRKKMPINGIVVAVSLSDLLSGEDDDIEWHVKVVRDRIDELVKHLGFLFPIYVVFTKCDLLKGFESYFGDLSEKEREQVWGSFLDRDIKSDEVEATISSHVDMLYEKLCDLRIRKLSMQRKHALKSEIFDFPAQFKASSERLIEFLSLLLRENPYHEYPSFKGVYFTSGTQEGLPLQRIVGNIRQAFGYVDKVPEAGEQKKEKSYFIHDFLKRVILSAPEQALMSREKKLTSRWLKGGLTVVSLVLVIGAILAFSASYTTNALILAEGNNAASALKQSIKNKSSVEPESYYVSLSRLYAHYVKLKKYQEHPKWYMHLGVYRGGDEIVPVESLLIHAMNKNFLPEVGQSVTDRLKEFEIKWKKVSNEKDYARLRDGYYDALKTYLMLSRPEHMDAVQATRYIYPVWNASRVINANMKDDPDALKDTENNLKGLVRLYLANMKVPNRDPLRSEHWLASDAVIEKARSQLRTPPNPELLYAQIKNKGRIILKSTGLKGLVKGRGVSYFDVGVRIPVLYTRKGWEKFASREIEESVLSASRGDWVLGTYVAKNDGNDIGDVDKKLSASLRRQIRYMYFRDYVTAWFDFLGKVDVARFENDDDAADRLLLLSRTDGPIANLLRVVNKNINLHNVSWKLRDGKIPDQGNILVSSVAELKSPFSDLRRFTEPGEKGKVSDLVNQYLITISSMQGEMERLRASSEPLRDSEIYASGMFSGNGRDTELYKTWVTTTGLINGTDLRTRNAIEPLFMSSIKNTWKTILASAMKELQKKWITNVVREYDDRIRGKFPFSKTGPDATLDDVAEFFRPDEGTLWSFVNGSLGPYLVRQRRSWRQRRWLNIKPGFSRKFLASLNKAQMISEALFKRGQDSPTMTFHLYPIPSAGVSEILLETNGQIYRYRNGPQEWRRFKWPGNKEPVGARVIAVSAKANFRAEVSAQGLWGIFHLLQKANVKSQRGAQYLSVWNMDSANGSPVHVSFKFKADRKNNLFIPGLFLGVNLPESLTGIYSKPKAVAIR